jgi:hypothetical protein
MRNVARLHNHDAGFYSELWLLKRKPIDSWKQ